MNCKVFISGPITGVLDYNKPEFDEAERKLTMLGCAVWNPIKLHPAEPNVFTHEDYLHVCFAMIERSDVVAMLPGWDESKGATQELRFATKNGISVYSYGMLLQLLEIRRKHGNTIGYDGVGQHDG